MENNITITKIDNNLTNFKVILPNWNYEALNIDPQKHIEDNNGGVNGGVKELSQRDANLYKIVRMYPGLRSTQIMEYAKSLDPDININIIQKRMKIMSDLIEFRGSSKSGGYYIK